MEATDLARDLQIDPKTKGPNGRVPIKIACRQLQPQPSEGWVKKRIRRRDISAIWFMGKWWVRVEEVRSAMRPREESDRAKSTAAAG